MEVTKEYIESHLTANGGYTKKSLSKLGIPWPPPKGWKEDLLNMNNVTNINRFFKPESDKSIVRKSKQKKKVAKWANTRAKVLIDLGLHETATGAGICFCIHKATGWPIPERKTLYRRYISKYYRRIRNNPKPHRKAQTKDFYKSKEWRELRFVALNLSEGTCQLCGARASDGVQIHVDHIKPRSKYPELALDLDNIQILCEDCNIGKSNYDDTDFREW